MGGGGDRADGVVARDAQAPIPPVRRRLHHHDARAVQLLAVRPRAGERQEVVWGGGRAGAAAVDEVQRLRAEEGLAVCWGGGEALPISLPVQARWHYTNYSDCIEMVPGSPASDALSSGSRKAIYFKRWEEDMV